MIGKPRVVLITRTRTQNQGNQALSVVWRNELARLFPKAELKLLERGPGYLKRYTVASFAGLSDPAKRFDEIARNLVAKATKVKPADVSRSDIELDPSMRLPVRFNKLRGMLKLRSRLNGLGVGEAEYLGRLRYILDADVVTVNPAGEFLPSGAETALTYLMETRCAQLAGKRTAFVNLSFEVTNPTVIALSDHVFRHCDLLEFRDTESEAYYASHGGRSVPVVLPDGAILSPVTRAAKTGGRGVALAINSLQVKHTGLDSAWVDVVGKLAGQGELTLTSNEWTTDEPFWDAYKSFPGVKTDGMFLPFDRYAELLGQFDLVISSRLHTCVLGMLAGVPVLPVEMETFKLTGFFNQIGMPNEPIRAGEPGWQEELLSRVGELTSDSKRRIEKQDAHVAEAQQRLRRGLDEAFFGINMKVAS